MATTSTSGRWWLAFFAVGFTLGCVVSLDPDKETFRCESDADCGGDGYICVIPTTVAPRCCKPAGDEVCGNAVDDDCDGQVDEGVAETCNGVDDDCDGTVDETFNLQTDILNCGSCGNACEATTHRCDQGACKVRGELNCSNMIDDDNDSTIDCGDLDCSNLSCGVGCTCRSGAKAETDCTNSIDDDLDGNPDCADTDCNGLACGAGCLCVGGSKTETNCTDGMDNNGDAGSDCADPNCSGQLCQAAPATWRCNAGGACGCRDAGTNPPAEATLALCNNGLDDECDGTVDCADPGCNGISCANDGGAACQCRNGIRSEGACADEVDNDGDFLVDCREMLRDGGGDCAIGVACTWRTGGGNPRAGTCGWDSALDAGNCR